MANTVHSIVLWDSETAVASAGSITSDAISQGKDFGFNSILLILSGTTTEVDVTITVGLTEDGTFYTPHSNDSRVVNTIIETLGATRWISFDAVLAPFIKITVTGTSNNGSNTTVRAYLITHGVLSGGQ